MARFNDCLAFTLKEEGGYSNNPADHGGATNYGVTQATYDNFRVGQGLPQQPVSMITLDETTQIYYSGYWVPSKAGQLPQPVDLCVFDTAVNSGASRAGMLLQAAVGVLQDGIVGRDTLTAVNAMPALAVATQFCDQREAFLRGIVSRDPTQARFLNGWVNRINDLRVACGIQTS
jgi:lysozyme family protein